MLSKAFSKSIMLMHKGDCHSILYCTMFLSIALRSVQLRRAKKPACSSLSFWSCPVPSQLMRPKVTLQNTLPAIFNSFYSGSDRLSLAAWLADLSSIPPVPAPCSIYIKLQRSKRTSSDISPPSLIASGGILLQPAAFPLFNFFIQLLIFTRVMQPVQMIILSTKNVIMTLPTLLLRLQNM